MPRVDVIILSYNYAAFLRDALESVLAQTFREFRVLVADDGSTDNSVELARMYRDDRVEVFCGEHVGLERNLARALQATSNELVAITSADDRWLPQHLEIGVAALDRDPAAGLSYSLLRQIDEQGRQIRKIRSSRAPVFPSGWVNPFDLLPGQFIPTQTSVFRRRAIDDVGGLDQTLHQLELDLIVRIVTKYPVVYTGMTTGEYRVHGNSLSSDPSAVLRARLALYSKHLTGVADTTRRQFVAAAYMKTAYRELATNPTRASTASARRHLLTALRTNPTAVRNPLSLAMLAAAVTGPAFPLLYRGLQRMLALRPVKMGLQRLLGLAGSSHYSFGARSGQPDTSSAPKSARTPEL